MKIVKILKTAGAVIAMGITTIAAGKFGDVASKTWNSNDKDDEDDNYVTPEDLDEIDDEEIKELAEEVKIEETED